jgi:two-component system chemotaxis response regulator CheB
MQKKIRVVVVDDSTFMRKKFKTLLESDPEIEVVGEGKNGLDGLNVVKRLKPDVVTLDMDMPVMDGLTALKHIMIENPTPVIVISSMFDNGNVTFNTLRLGAADFVNKPSGAISEDIGKQKELIIKRVKLAADLPLEDIKRVRVRKPINNRFVNPIPQHDSLLLEHLFTIGATVGKYTCAIKIISRFPKHFPAAVTVQTDVSPLVIPSFLDRLNEFSNLPLEALKDGLTLKHAHCYVVSSSNSVDFHRDRDGQTTVQLGSAVDKPFDQMFSSAAEAFKEKAVAILLCNPYDNDGVIGLRAIKRHHGKAISQDIHDPERHNRCECVIHQAIKSVSQYDNHPEALRARDECFA